MSTSTGYEPGKGTLHQQKVEHLNKIYTDMRAIVGTAESERRDLTADEAARWNKLDRELARVEQEITDLEDQAKREAREAVHGGVSEYRKDAPLSEGQTMAGFVRAFEPRATDGQYTPDGHSGELSLAKSLRGITTGEWRNADAERRAMGEGVAADGGYMVPTILSSEIIDLARNRTQVLQAGARTVPMTSRTLDIARWEGDPTHNFRAEHEEIVKSDATLGRVQLEAKALAALVVVSRELLEDAPNVEEELRAAFGAQMALQLDHAALYGSGTNSEPQGIKGASGVTVTELGTGDGETPSDYSFLTAAVGRLADVNETANGIIYAPRTHRLLGTLTDTTNQPLRQPPYLDDIPRYPTNQVSTALTVGTSTDASDAFVGDYTRLLIGMRTQFMLSVLRERYADFGQVGFLAWMRADVAVARPAAFNVVSGITAS